MIVPVRNLRLPSLGTLAHFATTTRQPSCARCVFFSKSAYDVSGAVHTPANSAPCAVPQVTAFMALIEVPPLMIARKQPYAIGAAALRTSLRLPERRLTSLTSSDSISATSQRNQRLPPSHACVAG